MPGEPSPRKSFTKSVSSLFRSKKKKEKEKADADSIRAASEREDPTPDAPVAAPVERPSTAPTKTAEPSYSSNYAAEAIPAAPTPAVVEPTPEPVPPVPKPDEAVAAPVPDEGVAALDQNQHIARPDRPALRLQHLALVQPAAERAGDGIGHPAHRVVLGFAHHRRHPGIVRVQLFGHRQRPDFHHPGLTDAGRLVPEGPAGFDHAVGRRLAGEDRIHRIQHRADRPEGLAEFDRPPPARGPGHPGLEKGLHACMHEHG